MILMQQVHRSVMPHSTVRVVLWSLRARSRGCRTRTPARILLAEDRAHLPSTDCYCSLRNLCASTIFSGLSVVAVARQLSVVAAGDRRDSISNRLTVIGRGRSRIRFLLYQSLAARDARLHFPAPGKRPGWMRRLTASARTGRVLSTCGHSSLIPTRCTTSTNGIDAFFLVPPVCYPSVLAIILRNTRE